MADFLKIVLPYFLANTRRDEGRPRVSANNQKKSYQAHEIQFGQGPYNNPLGQE